MSLTLLKRGVRAKPSQNNAGRVFALYRDTSLLNGVTDTSFNMTRNLAQKAGNVSESDANDDQVGVASVLCTPTAATGAFSLRFPDDLNLADYDYLCFAAKSDTGSLQWAVRMYDAAGATAGGAINFAPLTTGWKYFRYHLRQTATSFGAASLTATTPLVREIRWIENNGVYNAAPVMVDEIMLVKARARTASLPLVRPTRLLGDQIRSYQVAHGLWPVVSAADQYIVSDPFGTGTWQHYLPFIQGEFASESTEELLEYYERKWGFRKGYPPCHARIAHKLLQPGIAGLSIDYPDILKSRGQKESLWRQAQRADWRTINVDTPNKGYTSYGVFQSNHNNFGFYPGAKESLSYSIDIGAAIWRAIFDGSGNIAAIINSSGTTDIRVRRATQVYFSGTSFAEDGTSNPELGTYSNQVHGGTDYVPTVYTGNIVAKDWVADSAFRTVADYSG